MIEGVSKVRSEAQAKKQFSVQHWIDDLPWEQANERLESQPTVNIEGLVGGYTGPGGKTILPHRAVAKIDMRLVPDMKAGGRARGIEGASGQARLRRHRSEHDRRLRSDDHVGGLGVDPGAGGNLQKGRNRPVALAAQCRFVSRLRFHRRTAQARGRTFRSRSRQRRACAGRVLRHRIDEPENPGLRRRGDVVRRISLRTGEVITSAERCHFKLSDTSLIDKFAWLFP